MASKGCLKVIRGPAKRITSFIRDRMSGLKQ